MKQLSLLRININHILMESARRVDEATAFKQVPSMQAVGVS